MKCELFHDNFQTFKPVYFEQGEQMTIFDFLEDENGTT